MDNLEKNLELLGINGKEKDVYSCVLRLKKATVIELAKAASIKRTTVYHCLDTLIEKGLVIKVNKDNKKYYLAEDPEVSFNSLLQEKKIAIASVIPELKNLFGIGMYSPEIKVYRNIAGLRKMYEDILNSKEKLVRYYLSSTNLEELLGQDFVDNFVEKRIDKKIMSLALRSFDYKPEREQGTTHAKQYREVRFTPEKISIKPYMAIYDDKVAVISTPEEKLGFIIESKEFSEAQKTIFDMLWNSVAI